MGFRFRRSIKLGKYVKINLGKTGTSLSVGVRGAHATMNKNGLRQTVGLPGTGLSYTKYDRYNNSNIKALPEQNNINNVLYEVPEGVTIPPTPLKIRLWLYAGIILLIVGLFNVLFLLPAMAAIIVDIVLMLVSKDYKCSFNMQFAINAYRQGNFDKCIKYCNKTLKFRDYEGAKILIENIKINSK